MSKHYLLNEDDHDGAGKLLVAENEFLFFLCKVQALLIVVSLILAFISETNFRLIHFWVLLRFHKLQCRWLYNGIKIAFCAGGALLQRGARASVVDEGEGQAAEGRAEGAAQQRVEAKVSL